MFVLAVDTSTPRVTAGVVRVEGFAVTELSVAGHVDARAHNEVLTPLILESLGAAGISRADVSAVVPGCGPGPFTGLRVGMATAASFGDAWQVPVHGLCSLDALAHPGGEPMAGDVLAVTDARRREVYAAAYRDGGRVWGPAVLKAADVAAAVIEAVGDFEFTSLVGDEAKCGDVVAGLAEAGGDGPEIIAAYPSPAGLVAGAVADLADGRDADERDSAVDPEALLAAPAEPLVALYLRRPDATPPKDKPKSPAIPDVDVGKLTADGGTAPATDGAGA